MSDHDRFRDRTAAYVLGALDHEDRAELLDHLETCQRCQADVVDFAPLPTMLGLVDLADLDDPCTAHMADAVVAEARHHLDRVKASRRRWRAAAGALAVAALALVALGATAVFIDLDDDDWTELERIELAFEAVGDTSGAIAVDEQGWGTYVHVALEGLPERPVYRLWAIDQEGTWHEAGTWLPTPDRSATLGGSTHLRLDEIALLVITSDDPEDRVLETE